MNRLKLILLIPVLMVLYAVAALAEPIAIAWDANPPDEQVQGYRIYKAIPDAEAELLVETSAIEAVIDAEMGESIFVTAYRGGEESLPSAHLLLLPNLSKPSGLRIKVAVTVEVEQPEP